MKIITRRDRSSPLFVLVLAVISALIGILPQHSFAVPSQFLQPEIQQYFETTNVNYAINTGASGAISGTAYGSVAIPDAVRAIAEGFGFTIPAVLLSSGNNFNFSAPGITESLNLITSGPAVNYSYNVPYSLSFNMPTSVTAGQRVYLNPTVTWGNPLLQGSQSLEYMTSQSLSADAPGDGIASLKVSLNQSPTRLNKYRGFSPSRASFNRHTYSYSGFKQHPKHGAGRSQPIRHRKSYILWCH
jgi:hypothetical protein